MSGIFGIIDSKQSTTLSQRLPQMGRAMSHGKWFVVETIHDDEGWIGLGRVGIGIFNRSTQPVWNTEHTIALMMCGELYNTQQLDELISPHQEPHISDERRILALYERFGDEFPRHLNGAFIVVLWDKARRRMVIANDRFGLYPLYYARHAGQLIFAPEVKGLLCDPRLPKTLDMVALAQYVRFQHLLGQRTFFEGIELLPHASVLVCDLQTAACHITPYWSFDHIAPRPQVSLPEAVEEAGALLRRAVRRLSTGPYRPGVYLSGGLDSRTILGLIDRRPIVSLTYGREDCRDVYYARRIARAVGSDHHWFDLPNGEWVTEYAPLHMELTEGFHSWIHAHGISTLAHAREIMDVNLTGWDGGTIMGDPDTLEPLQTQAVDDNALLTRLFYLFNQKFTWPSITEPEERILYTPSVRSQVLGLAFDSFRSELAPYLNYRPDLRSGAFYLNNHCRRLTFNMVTVARSHIEVRFPFLDYDLIDFLYALPAQVRNDKRLFYALIRRETPRLARIPYDHDERLPTDRALPRRAHAALVRAKRLVNRHMLPIFADRFTLYADYEAYLRDELAPWAKEILFDRRTIERGLFDPAFLRTLLARHQSGLEEWTIGKIAPLMTYEMMLRRLYD